MIKSSLSESSIEINTQILSPPLQILNILTRLPATSSSSLSDASPSSEIPNLVDVSYDGGGIHVLSQSN